MIVKSIANQNGTQKLKQLEKSVPVMAVGDTFPEEPSGLHIIEPDHYHMGADLAQKLLENYRGNLTGRRLGSIRSMPLQKQCKKKEGDL